MAQDISTFITRRSMVAGLALTASPIALAGADNEYAQAKQTAPEKSLYERLGGVFAIAAVVDHFSDAIVKNPIVGQKSKNPQLREWHTKNLGRLPGLKFMRTLWVCDVSGGPFQFTATKPGTTALGLEGFVQASNSQTCHPVAPTDSVVMAPAIVGKRALIDERLASFHRRERCGPTSQ